MNDHDARPEDEDVADPGAAGTGTSRTPADPPPPAPPRTPAEAARYQRTRLWLGILGIGAVLVGTWASALWCLPRWWNDALTNAGAFGGTLVAAGLGLAAILLQLPFDVLGRRTEAAYGQLDGDAARRPLAGAWWRAWALSCGQWLGGLAIAGTLVGLAVAHDPERWTTWTLLAIAAVTLLDLALPVVPGRPWAPADDDRAAFQDWLDDVRRELRAMGLTWPPVKWFDHGERSLAGAWHGLGPLRQLALSRTVSELPPRTAAALVARELAHQRRGDRVLGWALSMAWIVLGTSAADLLAPSMLETARPEHVEAGRPELVAAAEPDDAAGTAPAEGTSPATDVPPPDVAPATDATYTPGDPVMSPAGVVFVLAITMTNACFVGLFVWPAIGRRQVLAADRAPLHRGMSGDDVLAMLDELATRNRPDEHLPPAKGYVFHPIPPMEVRRAATEEAAARLRPRDPLVERARDARRRAGGDSHEDLDDGDAFGEDASRDGGH